MTQYKQVVRDFADRTRKNLLFIEAHARSVGVYETTQLINSMLGLLIFPQQEYIRQIPETPLEELEAQGWPRIRPTQQIEKSPDYQPCKTLRQVVKYLRNSIAHFNIEFLSNGNGQINGLRMWNVDTFKKSRPKTWETEMSLGDLRLLVFKFVDLLVPTTAD